MARHVNPDFQDRLISKNQRIAKASGSIKNTDPSMLPLAEQIRLAEKFKEKELDKRFEDRKVEKVRYANWAGNRPEGV